MVNVQSSPRVIARSPNIPTCAQKPPIITSLNNHLWNQAPFLSHTSERTGITAIESGEIWGETHRSVQPLRRLDTDMRDEGKVTVCQRKSVLVPTREEGEGGSEGKGKRERKKRNDLQWQRKTSSGLNAGSRLLNIFRRHSGPGRQEPPLNMQAGRHLNGPLHSPTYVMAYGWLGT